MRDVRPDTDDAVVVSFDVPPELTTAFDFMPGQYLTSQLKLAGGATSTVRWVGPKYCRATRWMSSRVTSNVSGSSHTAGSRLAPASRVMIDDPFSMTRWPR